MANQSKSSTRSPLPLLDMEVIRSFITIAESGSFTRAAHQIFRTPSALSMQIKRLEETLGQALFVREARKVKLTPEGEILLGYARRLLKLNEDAVRRFVAPALAGTVRLGTPDDIGTRILPRVLTQFARSHPAVQVDVIVGRSEQMLRKLNRRELDLVLVTVGNQDLEADRGEIVHNEPLVWTGCQGGVAAQRDPLPLALSGPGCPWRNRALTALDRADKAYRIAYISEHCAGQEAALLADLAVAPFPASMVQDPLQILGDEAGLPDLGNYQIAMVSNNQSGTAGEILAGHVKAVFREWQG